MRVVLPHLKVGADGGPGLMAPLLIDPGLILLHAQTEASAWAMTGFNDFASRSGLLIWVQNSLWTSADKLRRRFTQEAVGAGRDEWTTRRVLLTALAAQGKRLSGEWPLNQEIGDYEHYEANRQ